jgi:hypothetical protein
VRIFCIFLTSSHNSFPRQFYLLDLVNKKEFYNSFPRKFYLLDLVNKKEFYLREHCVNVVNVIKIILSN